MHSRNLASCECLESMQIKRMNYKESTELYSVSLDTHTNTHTYTEKWSRYIQRIRNCNEIKSIQWEIGEKKYRKRLEGRNGDKLWDTDDAIESKYLYRCKHTKTHTCAWVWMHLIRHYCELNRCNCLAFVSRSDSVSTWVHQTQHLKPFVMECLGAVEGMNLSI